jgi:hypothetical protein
MTLVNGTLIDIGSLLHFSTLEARRSIADFLLSKLGRSLWSILGHAGSLGFNGTLTRGGLLTISGTLAWEWGTQTSCLDRNLAHSQSLVLSIWFVSSYSPLTLVHSVSLVLWGYNLFSMLKSLSFPNLPRL